MSQNSIERKRENVGGRPRKFGESSRPITVTLPESTIRALASVDSDRSRAIVKLAAWITKTEGANRPTVELVEVENGRAVIVVGPSRFLQQLPWLRLVEIAPARFLLVIPTGTAVESLEVAVMDMLDGLEESDEYERTLLNELQRCLTLQRRGMKVSKAELLLIDVS